MLLIEPRMIFPGDVRSKLEDLLGERIWFVVNTGNPVSVLSQAIGRDCDRRRVRVEERIQVAHVPIEDPNAVVARADSPRTAVDQVARDEMSEKAVAMSSVEIQQWVARGQDLLERTRWMIEGAPSDKVRALLARLPNSVSARGWNRPDRLRRASTVRAKSSILKAMTGREDIAVWCRDNNAGNARIRLERHRHRRYPRCPHESPPRSRRRCLRSHQRG